MQTRNTLEQIWIHNYSLLIWAKLKQTTPPPKKNKYNNNNKTKKLNKTKQNKNITAIIYKWPSSYPAFIENIGPIFLRAC